METKGTTYLGIDGGGTRCRARVEDESGRVLGEAGSGPAATRVGVDKVWRAILEATEAAAAQAGPAPEDLARMRGGIGLAGLGRRGPEAALSKFAHPFASVIFISDVMTTCLGAPWLTPDLRERLKRPNADAAAGVLLRARGRRAVPRREMDDEQAAKFRV